MTVKVETQVFYLKKIIIIMSDGKSLYTDWYLSVSK